MTQKSVLLIGVDGEPLRQMEAMLAATGAFNLALLTGTDDAAALDDAPEPALIITYLQDGEGLGAVDAALGGPLAQTAVPLVVVARRTTKPKHSPRSAWGSANTSACTSMATASSRSSPNCSK